MNDPTSTKENKHTKLLLEELREETFAQQGMRIRSPILAAFVVGISCILLAICVAYCLYNGAYEHQKSRFERMAERIHSHIKSRVSSYGNLLRGTRGALIVKPDLSRAEFSRYCESRDLVKEFPGILGLGYIERVPKNSLPEFVEKVRKDGTPDFKVSSAGNRDELFIIRFIDHGDQIAPELGIDIAVESRRRVAAERAMLTGEPVLTEDVDDSQGVNKSRFLYLLPVYRNGASIMTPTERKAACIGWTFMPLMLDEVMRAIPVAQERFMDVEIYEGEEWKNEKLIFDLDRHQAIIGQANVPMSYEERYYHTTIHANIGGQVWTLRFSSLPRFMADIDYSSAYATIALGFVLSLVLGTLTWMIGTCQKRATDVAVRMTADLRFSKEAALNALRDVTVMDTALDQYSLVTITDPAGRIIHVNESFCALSGYSREELVGQNHRIVNSGHHPRAFWVDMWQTVTSGRAWRGEICNHAKNGTPYWVDTLIIPFMNAKGELQKIFSVRFNITKRKLAEAENRMLANVARRTRNAAVLMDTSGQIEWVNEGFTRLTEYTLEEVKGKKKEEFLYGPNTDQAVVELRHAAIAAGKPFTGEYVQYSKSGMEYIMQIDIEPLFNERDRLTGFLSIQSDVTLERRMDSVIRANMENFRTLAEASPTLVWTSGRDGKRNYFNKRWLEFTGNSLLRELNNGWMERLHPDDVEHYLNVYQGAFHTHLPFEIEYRLQREDGSYRIMADRGSPRFNSENEFDGYVGAAMDITDDRMREVEILRLRLEAEEASRTKSEFLANMSHEIRTPMSAVLGYTDLMLNESEYLQDANLRRDALLTIQRNGNYLLQLINDILDLSKIEAGKMTVEHLDCSPTEIMREVESLMRERAQVKRLELKLEIDGPIPRTIQSDPLRLRQILLNLVGNAIKFTDQGSVRIVARHLRGADSRIEFDVIDTGSGMTSEQQDKIFRPFSQADSSTTRKFGGTGLGLTICRRLAEFLDGDVRVVSSKPGIGTIFRLSIVAENVSEELSDDKNVFATLDSKSDIDHSQDEASQTLPHGCRILLAEDGIDNQRMITFILKKAGASVAVANNGRIALDLVGSANQAGEPFDLVLMDMQMPELDGYAATRQLRQKNFTQPIIALTAHAMADDRDKCLEAGCNDYLSKPVSKARLLQLLNGYLKHEVVGK